MAAVLDGENVQESYSPYGVFTFAVVLGFLIQILCIIPAIPKRSVFFPEVNLNVLFIGETQWNVWVCLCFSFAVLWCNIFRISLLLVWPS